MSWACRPHCGGRGSGRPTLPAHTTARIASRVHFNTFRREMLDLEASRTPKKGCPWLSYRSLPTMKECVFPAMNCVALLLGIKRMCAGRVDRCPQCLECAQRLQALALLRWLEGPARKVVRRVREQRTILEVPGPLTKGGCSFAWCSFGFAVRVRPRVCTSNFSSKEAGGDQALLGRLEASVRLEMASGPF